ENRSTSGFAEYVYREYPFVQALPEDRREKLLRDVIDKMYEHGDPWTLENAKRRFIEVQAEDAAAVWEAEHRGEKILSAPAFVEKTPFSEQDFFNTASTKEIGDYLKRKYEQPEPAAAPPDGVETITTEQMRARFMGQAQPDPARPYR